MKNNNIKFLSFSLTIVIILIAATRIIPHEHNYVPVFAMILFASAYLKNRWQSVLIAIGVLWASDLYLNNWVYIQEGQPFQMFGAPFQYLAYISVALIGTKIFNKSISPPKVFGSSILAGIAFFLVSNFGVWLGGNMYPLNLEGLFTCYIAAAPFAKATFESNMLFTPVLFGGYYLLQKPFKSLQLNHIKYSKF